MTPAARRASLALLALLITAAAPLSASQITDWNALRPAPMVTK